MATSNRRRISTSLTDVTRANKWKPDRQRKALDLLREADLVLDIPWDEGMRADWEALYHAQDQAKLGRTQSWYLEAFQRDI
jgi:hypothetical protein